MYLGHTIDISDTFAKPGNNNQQPVIDFSTATLHPSTCVYTNPADKHDKRLINKGRPTVN